MNYKIDIQDLVPINRKGSENNAVAFLNCQSETEAFEKFKKLSQNLLKINDWNVKGGKNPTEFSIYNKDKSQSVQENDLVKIKIPAPENKLGNGFDWIVVKKIQIIEKTDVKVFLLQMKPNSCPENSNKKTAHFYMEDASSTFILSKKNDTIQFSIHGRNEIPNTKKIGFLNSCRNFFVANGGIFGGSKLQWQDFAEEFIKD
ncbi:hypothetical protein NZ698_19205 [Chryseobacterium sp. PBS4-4]|uniref:DUF1349 domain-containing protein n=1 Tax=Chryseobacterium edaphi TaxID=2976532 RepID=A0ABT2WAS8_9FLAO|nr:hypothetical protein [Chryseobacterium edaphi]MCU7619314.1 hypothetical protein [Chryseobacterium edaphi]